MVGFFSSRNDASSSASSEAGPSRPNRVAVVSEMPRMPVESIQTSTGSSRSSLNAQAPPPPERKKLQGWKHSAAGSLGGMAGAIVTSPFDVVKTRLQSDMFRHTNAPPVASIPKATAGTDAAVRSITAKRGSSGGLYQFVDTLYLIRRIGVEEGWRALYKGLGPALVGIIPARAINFYFYPTSKHFLAQRFPDAPGTSPGQTAIDSPVIHLGAAVIAGIMTATGTNPIWVVKTRMQLSARKRSPASPGLSTSPATTSPLSASPLPRPIAVSAAALSQSTPLSTASVTKRTSGFGSAITLTWEIMQKEGIRGLYRGLSASYLGVSEGVIQWVLYERFKSWSNISPTGTEDRKNILSYMGSIVGASGGAKAVASLLTYPHEVVRTRLRQPAINGVQKYRGLIQTLMLVVREEGFASLYGGLTAHMLRVVPNAACMFLIYELVAGKLG